MIKIKVFEERTNQRLSKGERTILYEKLVKTPVIPAYHYFIQKNLLEDAIGEDIDTTFIPSVVGFLIKKYIPALKSDGLPVHVSFVGTGMRDGTDVGLGTNVRVSEITQRKQEINSHVYRYYDQDNPDVMMIPFDNIPYTDKDKVLKLYDITIQLESLKNEAKLFYDCYIEDIIIQISQLKKEYDLWLEWQNNETSEIQSELEIPTQDFGEMTLLIRTPDGETNFRHSLGIPLIFDMDDIKRASATLNKRKEYLSSLKILWKYQSEQALRHRISLKMFGTTDLIHLTKYQLDQIETETKARYGLPTKEEEAIHLFRKAIKIRDRSYLREFMKEQHNICPHLLFLANTILKENWDMIKCLTTTAEKFSLFDKVDYYCKLCGELITKYDRATSSLVGDYITYDGDDKILNLIWREIVWVFNSVVSVSPMINIRLLAQNISTLFLVQLIQIDKKLDPDPIQHNHLLIIYTKIYLTILILFIQNKLPDEIKIRKGVTAPDFIYSSPIEGGVPIKMTPKQREDLKKMFVFAEDILVGALSNLIEKSSTVKLSDIKLIMAEAYRWSISMDERYFISEVIPKKNLDVTNYFKTDPLYRYIHRSKSILALKNGQQPPVYNDTETVIGIPLGTIEEKISEKTQFLYSKLDYSKLVIPEQNEHFSHWLAYSLSPPRLAIPPDPRLVAHYMKGEELIQKEEPMKKMLETTRCRFFTTIPVPEKYVKIREQKSIYNPSTEYDESGRKHKFNIAQYDDGSSMTIEESSSLIKSGKMKQQSFKNFKCSVCGASRDDVGGESESLARILMEKRNKKTFFDFYESSCPEGDIHSIIMRDGEKTCIKCSLGILADDKYYEKYSKKYAEVIKDRRYQYEMFSSRPEIRQSQYVPSRQKALPTSTENIHNLLRAHSEISLSVFLNVGLLHSSKMFDILNGIDNPSARATESQIEYQKVILHQYVLDYIRFYNSLKNIELVYDIKSSIMKIIRQYGSGYVKRIKSIDFSHILSVIPYATPTYILNWYAGQLLDLEKNEPNQMFKSIVSILLTTLKQSEELQCVPSVMAYVDDTQIDEDDDSPPPDMLEEGETVDKYPQMEEATDPFDLSHMDVDMDDIVDEDDAEIEKNGDF